MAIADTARWAAALSIAAALTGLRPGPAASGGAAAADRDRGESGAAHGRRSGRICRPLRRRRFGRRARARFRLSLGDPFHRRPDGEEGRSPVRHRSPAVPDRARPDARQSGAGARQPRLHRGRSRARPGACCTTRPSPSRPTTSACRPSAWPKPPSRRRRRWCIPAELDLNEYSELRAPIDGRIGDRRVSVGNLVNGGFGGNSTLLATIVSVDPIRFEFTFDEASYLRYQRFAGASAQMASGQGGVPVALKLIDEPDFQHTGRMDFVDNVIDRSSGTIRGRAVFANPGRHLHARHVRPRPRARLAALHRAAWCPTRRSAPSRRANSCWWSMTAASRGRNTSRSASSTTACA